MTIAVFGEKRYVVVLRHHCRHVVETACYAPNQTSFFDGKFLDTRVSGECFLG
jgi:hypothetical protein